MPEIPNVVGHVVGPLIWIAFLALMLWYGVRGAVVERRDAAARAGRRRRFRVTRGDIEARR